MSCSSFAYHPPTHVTVYGDDAYPPYSYLENGEQKGIYPEILRAVFAKMPDYVVTITLLPWRRGLKMLEVGEGFALFPPYYYSDKRAYISPYSDPILEEEVVVYCNPNKVASRKLSQWPDGYFGLTIGINEGYALGGDAFWAAVTQGDIFVKEAKGTKSSLINLYKNRVDCYINDRLSILWEIKLLTVQGVFKPDWALTLATSVGGEHGYLGFGDVANEKYPFKEEFIRQFNQALHTLKQDGSIDAVLANYLEN
ncbi:ABC transporter substrate-binding protein [Vibrio galatheae]|uniref:ABC transporter substrate-binding protein n=1 Tax=Vibrio galatheae TaxID=579748 RepID=A0A0F4NLN0_9VIBR|nr:ABC transporter substrate-binding protein [Vibrio galatheae]